MLRLGDDRGAVAVIVAILMVPLLGFAAVSLDIAATYSERQQLQTGADAAALAIAQDCARKACGSPTLTAQKFATLNSNSGEAFATLKSVPTAASGRVTVNNSAVRNHWFAPVLGVDSTKLTTLSSAAWGSPTGGTAVLPLILPLCEVKKHADANNRPMSVEQIIDTKPASCPPNGGIHNLPGGFGWLQPDQNESCAVTTEINGTARSQPGNKLKHCDLSPIRNRTVLVPIFDDSRSGSVNGGGNNGTYVVYGYAAFHVTGYEFTSQSWGDITCSGPGNSGRCIRGYFTELHLANPDFDYGPGAPNLGASAVYLLPDQ